MSNTVTLVNSSAIAGSAGSTTAAPNMPGSGYAIGNLLIAWVQCSSAPNLTFSVNNGWTIGGTAKDGTASSCWAYLVLANISPLAPTFSWGGGTFEWHGRINQFAGNEPNSPIGASNNATGTGTTLTSASLATTNDKSMVTNILLADVSSQVIPTPSGYTLINAFNDSNGSDKETYQTIPTLGASSTAVSVAITSAHWASFSIEIRAAKLWTENVVLNNAASGASSYNGALTTSGTNRVALVIVETNNPGGTYATVSSVTASGLTFVQRSQKQNADDFQNLEVWWAPVAGSVSGLTVTATLSGTANSGIISIIPVAGCFDITHPFDSHASVPDYNSTGVTSVTPEVTGASTNNTDDLILTVFGSIGTTNPTWDTPAKFWITQASSHNVNGTAGSFLAVETFLVNSKLVSATVGASASSQAAWSLIVDALTANATAPIASVNLNFAKASFAASGFTRPDVLMNFSKASILARGAQLTVNTSYNSWWFQST